MTIDDRLAKDAEAWRRTDAAPPFDAALDAATRPRRGARGTWLAVAATIAAIAVVAGFAVAGRGDDHDVPTVVHTAAPYTGPLPTPHTKTRDGHTYVVGVINAQGAALDPSHPRQVSIYSLDKYDEQNDPRCNSFGSSARIVSETPAAVTIVTFAYRSPLLGHGSGYVGCSFVASTGVAWPPQLTVQLEHPLGDRALLDAKSGLPIAVFGVRALPPAPAYLPPGFVRDGTEPLTRSSSDTDGVRSYADRAGGSSLDIHLESTSFWKLTDPITGHVTIGRYAAVVYENSYERCVSWSADAGRHLEVCSSDQHKHFLAADELVRIARSLPRS